MARIRRHRIQRMAWQRNISISVSVCMRVLSIAYVAWRNKTCCINEGGDSSSAGENWHHEKRRENGGSENQAQWRIGSGVSARAAWRKSTARSGAGEMAYQRRKCIKARGIGSISGINAAASGMAMIIYNGVNNVFLMVA